MGSTRHRGPLIEGLRSACKGVQGSRREGVPMNMVTIDSDGADLFVVVDGLRIAKRGDPGTPQAGTWISLEPGWTVRDCQDGGPIEIEHNDVRVHWP